MPDDKPPKAKEMKAEDKLTTAEKAALKTSCGKSIPTKVKTRRELVAWRIEDLGGRVL